MPLVSLRSSGLAMASTFLIVNLSKNVKVSDFAHFRFIFVMIQILKHVRIIFMGTGIGEQA